MKPTTQVRKLLRRIKFHEVKWDKIHYVFLYRHDQEHFTPQDFRVRSMVRNVMAEIVDIMTVHDTNSICSTCGFKANKDEVKEETPIEVTR